MALTKWSPSNGLSSLRRDMDRLFEAFFDHGEMADWRTSFEPSVDVSDTNDAIVVKAQVPGISKDDLHVEVTDDVLTLKGETKQEEKEEDKNYYRREIRYGSFSRTIPLPAAVQSDQAAAKMKDGVVEITIPKSEKAKVKQISVQAS